MAEKHKYEIKAKYRDKEIIFFKEAFCIGEVWNERMNVEEVDPLSGVICIFPSSCIHSIRRVD